MARQNQDKIYMQDWLLLHTYRLASSDDQWYLSFAEQLIPLLKKSPLLTSFTCADYKDLALTLTLYLEDALAVKGGWHRFKSGIKELYGRILPFYKLDATTYYDDEINPEDVQFILWAFLSSPQDHLGDDYIFMDPYAKDLVNLAQLVYTKMDLLFEEAPVTEAQTIDWVMDMEQLLIKRKEMPSLRLEDCTSPNSKKVLQSTGGYPLVYFESYQELASYFVEVLGWENTEEALMPEMKSYTHFILFANAKGIILAPEVAPYFKNERNPLYDEKLAKSEGYVLFCEQGACPFDLLKYGLKNAYFEDFELPFPQGKTLLRENWEFIARWYLGEYFEGD
ncbi:MAG: DUF3843 family protein [Bacteroides sp.]